MQNQPLLDQAHGLVGMMMMGQQLDLMVEIFSNFSESIILQKVACFNF